MVAWLAADPRRGRATWVNSRSKPLLWEADGKQYSPSRLASHIREEALGKPFNNAVQGTRYWFVPGSGSLVDLSEQALEPEIS